MKKSEIIRAVAEATDQEVKVTGKIIDAFLYEIQEMLSSGGIVELAGFGKFRVVDRKERKGRNPRTGEEITIPKHKTPIFSAAKKLNDCVKGK